MPAFTTTLETYSEIARTIDRITERNAYEGSSNWQNNITNDVEDITNFNNGSVLKFVITTAMDWIIFQTRNSQATHLPEYEVQLNNNLNNAIDYFDGFTDNEKQVFYHMFIEFNTCTRDQKKDMWSYVKNL